MADLPDIGSLSWRCDNKSGPVDFRYSTTFTQATRATETVSYSLDGGSSVSKVLQPGSGMAVSTPFVSATVHRWRIVQAVEPYTTKATIVATFRGNPHGQCLYPTLDVSLVRVSHMAP
jgi:hypothetical protein